MGKNLASNRLKIPSTEDRAAAAFLRKLSPLFDVLKFYFRYELLGSERIPARKAALIVMNHGVMPFHTLLMIREIFRQRGVVPRTLVADILMRFPPLERLASRVGSVRASRKNATELLNAGHLVLVAPGGNYEAMLARPGMREIPWHGRRGYAEIACRTGVPVVPSYCRGLNETYFNSRFLLDTRMRILRKYRASLPFFFGIGLIPFPVKLTHVVGRPIDPDRKSGESYEKAAWRLHRKVVVAMQALAEGRE